MWKPVFALIMLVLILSVITLQAKADTGKDSFDTGVVAFKNADYVRAKNAFEKAREEGLDTPSLRYNLAATYYRLGDYDKADEQFRSLTRESGWKNLAYYNRGLIAEKQGSSREARAFYRKALSSRKSKVNALADRALSRLSIVSPSDYLFVSVFAGEDDNVTLLPDQEGQGQKDSQVTGFITGRHYLNSKWSLEGLLYGRRHDEVHAFDTSLVEIGVHREHRQNAWHWDNAANVSFQSLNGERYLQSARLEARGRRNLSHQQSLETGAELSRIQAEDGFRYLQGWQARGHLDWRKKAGEIQWKLGYRLEINDRENLQSDNDFASFSPVRHRVRTDVSWLFMSGWGAQASAFYQHSDYRKEHVIQGESIHRKDDRLSASTRVDFSPTPKWKLFAQYRHTDNHSSLRIYDYERNEWSIGFEYLNFY